MLQISFSHLRVIICSRKHYNKQYARLVFLIQTANNVKDKNRRQSRTSVNFV